MNKEIKILVMEAARYKVLLEYAIDSLNGKTVLKNSYLADYLTERIKETEKEIEQIKQTQ